ncbi:MAG: hypothetical protein JJE53_02450 [Candidatus Pacebacteria bacterium]|nr:hypothetical protein [Candidatus Paceibacterota bacterium]
MVKLIKNPIFLGLYAYIITILTQYGFNSYFGITSNLIEPSIRDNIIFIYSLLKVFSTISITILFLIIFIALIWCFRKYKKSIYSFYIKNKEYIDLLIVISLISSLFVFDRLGNYLAKMSKNFDVISGECLPFKDNTTYIVPAFYQTKAIVIPVSMGDNPKLLGGLFLKEPMGPECNLQKNIKIGQILK